jgi:hypothetical protein
MTIHVQLAPEAEANLLSRAEAQGMTLDAYLQSILERMAVTPGPPPVSLEQFEAGLDELAEGSEHLPVLPPQAYSREGIYGDG